MQAELVNFHGIPKVYDFQIDRDWVSKGREVKKVTYILMEYLTGGELFDFIKQAETINQRLSEDSLRYIFSKLLYSLYRIHMAGIAHRDIKSENIVITADFEVKVIDFGLSGEMIGH